MEEEKRAKKKKSGLGIAGFSLSIIAFIFAFAGWAGTILAIISLGLAAAGFLTARRKNKGRKLAVAGAAISVGAVLLSIPFMSMWTGDNYTAVEPEVSEEVTVEPTEEEPELVEDEPEETPSEEPEEETPEPEETEPEEEPEPEESQVAEEAEEEPEESAEPEESGASFTWPTASTFTEQTKTIENWEITVSSVETVRSIRINWATMYQAEDGCKYVKVNMTIKNTGTELDYFGLTTTAALVYGDYNYSPQSMLIEDDLLYESVNPLVSVTGFLAFEVPTEVANSDEPCSLVVTTWDGESISFDLG